MKTSLDGFYKTNKNFEMKGVWFDIKGGASFLIKRMGGQNSSTIKKITAAKYKPYTRQLQADTLSEEIADRLSLEIFVEVAVLDWKGIIIDGEETPFSKEKCVELFQNLPELADTLLKYATNVEYFKEELAEEYAEDVGNS